MPERGIADYLSAVNIIKRVTEKFVAICYSLSAYVTFSPIADGKYLHEFPISSGPSVTGAIINGGQESR